MYEPPINPVFHPRRFWRAAPLWLRYSIAFCGGSLFTSTVHSIVVMLVT